MARGMTTNRWLWGMDDTDARREWAELHGYIYKCPVCGRGPEDTEGPCSDRCEEIYNEWEEPLWEPDVPR